MIISGLRLPLKDRFWGFLLPLHPFRPRETEPPFACCVSGGLSHCWGPALLKAEFIQCYYKRKTSRPTFPLNALDWNQKSSPFNLVLESVLVIKSHLTFVLHSSESHGMLIDPLACFRNKAWENGIQEHIRGWFEWAELAFSVFHVYAIKKS